MNETVEYVQALGKPALNLRQTPGGEVVAKIPYQAVAEVVEWPEEGEWALLSWLGRQGYAMKSYLKAITKEEARLENTGVEATFEDPFTYSIASGKLLPYVVIQVTLKEKWIGTGSRNLDELEEVINRYAQGGYRLHTMSTATSGNMGGFGGERIQATLVFERKDF